MHDLIDPWPVMSKALKQIRSGNDTNHPLNLCKTRWYEKDIGNLMPVSLFSRLKGIKQAFAKYMLYCPFFQAKEGSKGIICHGGEKLPGISKPHLSSSARKTEMNIADMKAGIKSCEFKMWI